MFGLLRNIAWTNEGAIDIEELPTRRLKARLAQLDARIEVIRELRKVRLPIMKRSSSTSRTSAACPKPN